MDAQTRTSGEGAATLGLGSVLVGSLPAALLTDHAPDRYTVEAVFTRRPDQDELTEILGDETRERLSKAGYPTAQVTVSDRRLEIANTTLEELRDGLGQVLADRLAEISAGVRERRSVAAERIRDVAEEEQGRVAAVTALAESVSFGVSADTGRGSSSEPTADRTQIDDWTDEGGHGRSARP